MKREFEWKRRGSVGSSQAEKPPSSARQSSAVGDDDRVVGDVLGGGLSECRTVRAEGRSRRVGLGRVDVVGSGRRQLLEEDRGRVLALGPLVVAVGHFLLRDADADDELLGNRVGDRRKHLGGEFHAGLGTAAVLVVASVRVRREELVE